MEKSFQKLFRRHNVILFKYGHVKSLTEVSRCVGISRGALSTKYGPQCLGARHGHAGERRQLGKTAQQSLSRHINKFDPRPHPMPRKHSAPNRVGPHRVSRKPQLSRDCRRFRGQHRRKYSELWGRRSFLTTGLTLPPACYRTTDSQAHFLRELLPRLEALHGVISAAAALDSPATAANSKCRAWRTSSAGRAALSHAAANTSRPSVCV